MNGFLILDKPAGRTSFDVVAQVRKKLDVKRVGHLGTLDPLATGVLVVAVGEGTKLIEYLMGLDKVYEVELEFGKVSDTYDREGKVQETSAKPAPREKIDTALKAFLGDIEQVPPAFSALKVKGKRAYELARQGVSVELKPRPVRVYSIEVIHFEWPFLRLRVHCGTGTYIRSLVHDLGGKLGVGALMTELRRTRVGPFALDHALADHLTPLEEVVRDWPAFSLSDHEFQKIRQGQRFAKAPDFPLPTNGFPVAGFYRGKLVCLLGTTPDGFVRVLKNLNVALAELAP